MKLETPRGRGRRGNREGSAPHERKDGRWEAKITTGYTPEGKIVRKSIYGASRAEVVAEMNRLKAQQGGAPLPVLSTGPLTLSELLNRWLETVVKPARAKKTYKCYFNHCRLHILPALGGMRIDKIAPMHVQSFVADLARKEVNDKRLSPETQRGIFAVLQSALSQAVIWQLIVVNPCSRVTRPKVPKKVRPHWTPEEARAFLACAREDRFGALYVVALATGLRLGEILGLRWSRVNLVSGELHVDSQVCEVDGDLFEEPPKRGSIRTVILPGAAKAALELQQARLASEGLGSCVWVFPDTCGGPMRQSNLVRRSFHPLVKKAGVRAITFHGLRHTFATMALGKAQVDVKTLQELLGHSDPALTLRIYSHALPGNKHLAAENIGALLGPGRAES